MPHEEPYALPFDREAASQLVERFFDSLICWDLPDNTVGFLGSDGDLLESLADVTIPVVRARYDSGELTDLRLVTKGVWDRDLKPRLSADGMPVVELSVTKKETNP